MSIACNNTVLCCRHTRQAHLNEPAACKNEPYCYFSNKGEEARASRITSFTDNKLSL